MTDETDGEHPLPDPREVVDAGSPEGVARATKERNRKQSRSDELWTAFLATPIGREQIWAVLQDLGTWETRYGCGPNGFPQETQTYFNLGQRDYGLRLYRSLLVIDGPMVLLMHTENDPAFKKAK